MSLTNRRDFLQWAAAGVAALSAGVSMAAPMLPATRGVVLYPFDLTLADWPERAAKAGINTIALHAARRLDVLQEWLVSTAGQRFLSECRERSIAVEYELHAMGELLSRELFYQDDTLFRVDEMGQRNADFNCCPANAQGLEMIAKKAVQWAEVFRPTTGRYFYWADDGRGWCHCETCKNFSPSEQALLVENSMIRALRQVDPRATLSHIAYLVTLDPPLKVKPEPEVFLEFAPITRKYDVPYDQQPELKDPIALLDANLKVFPAATAQVLEYWLDVSRFSGWRRPAQLLKWHDDVFRADVKAYRQRGVVHVTSFATWLDADYVQRHGDPQFALDAYGRGLR